MKYLILAITLMVSSSYANEVTPKMLQDGVITVKLKDGKTYTFSSNEYMVVKRGKKKPSLIERAPSIEVQPIASSKKEKRLKHIISGEVVRSDRGFDDSRTANQVEVESRRRIGVGIQYQYNIYQDLFIGGRADTNGGTGVNLGVGF
jgi:hypothetical protein